MFFDYSHEFEHNGKKYRYTCAVDPYARMNESPAEWLGNEHVVFYKLSKDTRYTDNSAADVDSIETYEVVSGLIEQYTSPTEEQKAEALTKHYTRKGWDCCTMDASGFGDYRQAFIACEEGYGKAELLAEEMHDFLNGDIYVLTLDKGTVWTSDEGETRTEWETIDSCGDVYATGENIEEVFADYARECFYLD